MADRLAIGGRTLPPPPPSTIPVDTHPRSGDPALVPEPHVLALLLVITAAYTCAGALGFGANVLSVALGAHLLPIELILPAILPTTWGLSAWIAWHQRDQIAWRVLLREVLPLVLLGFPFGLFVFQTADTGVLPRLLGGIIAGLVLLELLRPAAADRPPRKLFSRALLVGGGFVQGLFASGGPLVVYVLSRRDLSKGSFRASLCVLWVLLNSVLLVSYGSTGRLNGESLAVTAWAIIPLLVGRVLGQRLHTRLVGPAFQRAVQLVLLASGLVLLFRG